MKKQLICLTITAVITVLTIGDYKLLDKVPNESNNSYTTTLIK